MNTITSGAFSPRGLNVTLAVGIASASVALSPAAAREAGGTIRLLNVGANVVHVAFGDSTVTAVNPDSMPMAPNTGLVRDLPPGTTHVAAISGVAGNTLHVQAGLGI